MLFAYPLFLKLVLYVLVALVAAGWMLLAGLAVRAFIRDGTTAPSGPKASLIEPGPWYYGTHAPGWCYVLHGGKATRDTVRSHYVLWLPTEELARHVAEVLNRDEREQRTARNYAEAVFEDGEEVEDPFPPHPMLRKQEEAP